MMRRNPVLALSVLLLVAVSPLSLPAQVRRRAAVTTPPILERNIRAELSFLASDAMQGRGSGTNYERVAAEYIGSQFRQFGLEPAGDADSAGNKSFVQRVALGSAKFTEAPVLTVASGSNTHKWQFGQDFLVSFLRAPRIAGDLQIIDPEGAPKKGAVVVIKSAEVLNQRQRQNVLMKARSADAVAVVVLESDANRKTREAGNVRLPNLPPTLSSAANGEQAFVVIALRKEALDSLLTVPEGTKVEFAGVTQSTDASATWNAIGVLPGTDKRADSEAIMLSAHLDHLGVDEN